MKAATLLSAQPQRSSQRATLAAKIEERTRARDALQQATETLKTATEAVQAIEKDVASYDGLDSAIAEARTSLLKRGASRPLPTNLSSKRVARRLVRERMEEN